MTRFQPATAESLIELIDTLWNVNDRQIKEIGDIAFRINRYIMECKCHSIYAVCTFYIELIDTLWNVNTMIEQMRRLAT